jgi:hypothetical protein
MIRLYTFSCHTYCRSREYYVPSSKLLLPQKDTVDWNYCTNTLELKVFTKVFVFILVVVSFALAVPTLVAR